MTVLAFRFTDNLVVVGHSANLVAYTWVPDQLQSSRTCSWAAPFALTAMLQWRAYILS